MSPVSSFDELQSSGTNRTLMEEDQTLGCLHPVNSREVLVRPFLDRMHLVGADQTLGCMRLVDSSMVLESVFLDRTRPVNADRTLVRVRSELNGSF